ncbi:MAG: hypothetical protein HYT71_00580 [Candidatus Aenigmarchaeota archaeon]|nr:hypothetical protein [Candidatus Aenigmarchaeota archaeon]
MKAITPVIALVMLMLITVGIVGIAYTWFSGIASSQTSNTFKITPISGNKIMVANLGSSDLDTNNLKIFVGDGEAGVANPSKIQPGKASVLEIIPHGYGELDGRVMSNSMAYDFNVNIACPSMANFKQNDVLRFRWHNDCAEDGGIGLSNVNGGPTCTGCDDPVLTGIIVRDKDGAAIGSWSGSLQTGDSINPKIENRFIDVTVTQSSANGPFYVEPSFTGLNKPQDQQLWLFSVNGIDKRTYLGDAGSGAKMQIPCAKTYACINSITLGSALKIRIEHKSYGDYDNDLQASCAYTEDTDDFHLRKIEVLDKDNVVLAVNTTTKWIADVSNGVQNFDAYIYYLTAAQSSSNGPFKLRITNYDLDTGPAEFDLININNGFVGYVGDITGGGAGVEYAYTTGICT